MFLPKHLALAVSGMLVLPSVLAAQPVQKVKPPVSQATIDLATFSGGAPMPGGGAGLVGSLFGATGKDNSFGMTQAQSPGRWMDVTPPHPQQRQADDGDAKPAGRYEAGACAEPGGAGPGAGRGGSTSMRSTT